MTDTPKYREIPYNYTSFSDREIILRYFDAQTWETLDDLRRQRVTGRSAKLLFEVIGDIFLLDRNPYVFNDFLDNPHKQHRLRRVHRRKLDIIAKGAGDDRVTGILQKVEAADRHLFLRLKDEPARRRRIVHVLKRATAKENIRFSAFHKVLHATDATDWRVEYPVAVVYPESESQMAALVEGAIRLGLKIIPRGGGTGLTGGAVPVHPDTLIVNTEKLSRIGNIEEVMCDGRIIPVVEVQAGAITDHVAKACESRGYIFATDPTSAWASTIGGNIAENCGGKKAVMWGTAIDNLFSFRIVDARGDILEVCRRNHPHRKILPSDTVIFDVFRAGEETTPLRTIELKGTDIRRAGVGKDITNKALNGLPGVQKEGGDGIIVSARFVLYRPFAFTRTVCLEFYGKDLINASRAIVAVRNAFEGQSTVFLTALEHFDDKYAQAVNYRNKSSRSESPRAVLLIDVESDDEQCLQKRCDELLQIVSPFNCEGFLAADTTQRQLFWKDRKNLGAIARHTNAFKLNEDVVIPIESLPEFATFIDELNRNKEQANRTACANRLATCLATWPDDEFFSERRSRALAMLAQDEPDIPAVRALFAGYDERLRQFDAVLAAEQTRRIIIATHMHAGDGNIHVNIPVHSGDYEMMREAHDTAGTIMRRTSELGGVISGEHGIGLTKLRFIDRELIDRYQRYKDEADPLHLFNPGKLIADFPHHAVYTPSLHLLNKEALILEAADLKELTSSISACVRCGKCKENCNTQYPAGNTHYCPRNKILGVSLIIEAILYEAQTARNLTLRNFRMLTEIASYCTMCHNCFAPCPVNIDFGDVTLALRRLLMQRRRARMKPLTRMTLFYLKRRGFHFNRFMRLALLRGGYGAQRTARLALTPLRRLTAKVTPVLHHLLDGRFPVAGTPTIREVFGLRRSDTFYAIENRQMPVAASVLYFPGCGSERMFSDISFAALAMLYRAGVRVVIPPEYLCCGYPLVANGRGAQAEAIAYENSVTFHRIAETVSYMNIGHVLVTCGTCKEMLARYRLEEIFVDSVLMDVNEFLVGQGLWTTEGVTDGAVLFHEPCHSPISSGASAKVVSALLNKSAVMIPRCCGEGGTLALSTPHISTVLRSRKAKLIGDAAGTPGVTVLTTCPSCVQGLSKIHGAVRVTGRSLIVAAAQLRLGGRWKREFVADVRRANAIEHILF